MILPYRAWPLWKPTARQIKYQTYRKHELAQKKAKYWANPERARQINREWWAKNKKRFTKRKNLDKRKFYWANREKILAKQAEYRERNREKIRERDKVYRDSLKDIASIKYRLWRESRKARKIAVNEATQG